MAKKPRQSSASQRSDLKPSAENPFIRIPFDGADLQSYISPGGGAKVLPGVDVDRTYRATLGATLVRSQQAVEHELVRHQESWSTLVLTLRDKAIAKSHRPLHLAAKCEALLAGHAKLNEMLIGVDRLRIDKLARLIESDETQNTRANLSTIMHFAPWSRARRNPGGTASLRNAGRTLLQPFSYHNAEEKTKANWQNIERLLKRVNARYRHLLHDTQAPLLELLDMDQWTEEMLDSLLSYPGLRRADPSPMVAASNPGSAISLGVPALTPIAPPDQAWPVVAVFDTGVAPGHSQLEPWVVGRNTFVLPPDTDHVHGTAVASLVVAGHQLNAGFPRSPCRVFDVAGLEVAKSYISDLIDRLRDAVDQTPDVKIWNLSLGAEVGCNEQEFSEFAQALDALSAKHGVLFVVSAGNYTDMPRRGWPVTKHLQGDRISSPGDSVTALTVGALAQAGNYSTIVQGGEPAPYSRRGPGPVHTVKPEITHWGGNIHHPFQSGVCSTTVLTPQGYTSQLSGTSFSAPIASALCAHTWQALSGHREFNPSPAMVKAAMIHAAQLENREYSPLERRYYGVGLPQDVMSTLYDRSDSFTLLFEADLIPGKMRWRKTPYPIPASLRSNGKLRGEVIITAAYQPVLDANWGAEYVRTNLELSFGVLNTAKNTIQGKVPLEMEPGQHSFEKQLIENGGKWSTVKLHRKTFPDGVAGDVWALQAKLQVRAAQDKPDFPVKAYIFVTLRSVDGDTSVHADGLNALRATQWVQQSLPVRVPVQAS